VIVGQVLGESGQPETGARPLVIERARIPAAPIDAVENVLDSVANVGDIRRRLLCLASEQPQFIARTSSRPPDPSGT